jgi:8-oxo-dGTP diphosphatase
MLEVKIFDLGYCKNEELTRVVCVSKYKDKYVFSYNKKRNGWEIPGGHIEEGETWEEAAKREMYEETGATKIELEPINIYKITSYVLLCYCKILKMEELPKEFEMEKIMFSKTLPKDLTYPDSYKIFFETVINKKN